MGVKYKRWEEQMLFVSLGVLGKRLSSSQGIWEGARFCMLTSMPQHFICAEFISLQFHPSPPWVRAEMKIWSEAALVP